MDPKKIDALADITATLNFLTETASAKISEYQAELGRVATGIPARRGGLGWRRDNSRGWAIMYYDPGDDTWNRLDGANREIKIEGAELLDGLVEEVFKQGILLRARLTGEESEK